MLFPAFWLRRSVPKYDIYREVQLIQTGWFNRRHPLIDFAEPSPSCQRDPAEVRTRASGLQSSAATNYTTGSVLWFCFLLDPNLDLESSKNWKSYSRSGCHSLDFLMNSNADLRYIHCHVNYNHWMHRTSAVELIRNTSSHAMVAWKWVKLNYRATRYADPSI